MQVDIEDAYLTLYSGQDFADAIDRVLRVGDPLARTHFEPTGRTIPQLVWMDGERNWFWEASELAQAVGMRLKRMQGGVWVLCPAESPILGEFEFE
jgi:hypothetical protein